MSYGLNLGWGGPIGDYKGFWGGPIKGYTTNLVHSNDRLLQSAYYKFSPGLTCLGVLGADPVLASTGWSKLHQPQQLSADSAGGCVLLYPNSISSVTYMSCSLNSLKGTIEGVI